MSYMTSPTLDSEIDKKLENAWRDYVPKSYPGHDVFDTRILVARPDAWIVFKVMALSKARKIYYCEIEDGQKDERTYKICKGNEALIKEFRKLQNAPGLRFEGMQTADIKVKAEA